MVCCDIESIGLICKRVDCSANGKIRCAEIGQADGRSCGNS